jgi:hypothetical protein
MLMLLLFSLFFSMKQMRKLFNLAIILMGLRFLIVYFQVIGSLLFTGFGLIISGLLIVGVAMLYFKHRAKIENFFNRLIK